MFPSFLSFLCFKGFILFLFIFQTLILVLGSCDQTNNSFVEECTTKWGNGWVDSSVVHPASSGHRRSGPLCLVVLRQNERLSEGVAHPAEGQGLRWGIGAGFSIQSGQRCPRPQAPRGPPLGLPQSESLAFPLRWESPGESSPPPSPTPIWKSCTVFRYAPLP